MNIKYLNNYALNRRFAIALAMLAVALAFAKAILILAGILAFFMVAAKVFEFGPQVNNHYSNNNPDLFNHTNRVFIIGIGHKSVPGHHVGDSEFLLS